MKNKVNHHKEVFDPLKDYSNNESPYVSDIKNTNQQDYVILEAKDKYNFDLAHQNNKFPQTDINKQKLYPVHNMANKQTVWQHTQMNTVNQPNFHNINQNYFRGDLNNGYSSVNLKNNHFQPYEQFPNAQVNQQSFNNYNPNIAYTANGSQQPVYANGQYVNGLQNYESFYNQNQLYQNNIDYASLNQSNSKGDSSNIKKDDALSGFGPNRDLPKNWKSDLDQHAIGNRLVNNSNILEIHDTSDIQ